MGARNAAHRFAPHRRNRGVLSQGDTWQGAFRALCATVAEQSGGVRYGSLTVMLPTDNHAAVAEHEATAIAVCYGLALRVARHGPSLRLDVSIGEGLS